MAGGHLCPESSISARYHGREQLHTRDNISSCGRYPPNPKPESISPTDRSNADLLIASLTHYQSETRTTDATILQNESMNPFRNPFLGTSAVLDVSAHVIGLRAIRHRHALQQHVSNPGGYRPAGNSGRTGVGMVPRSPFGSAIHLIWHGDTCVPSH